ncbi:MAG: glycosyltransferase family 39 protein, partial [Elusimicrobiota bacterium]
KKELNRLFWILNTGTAIIRLFIIGRIGLSGDEAHYWTYTQHPALSYFDHPPLIAWIIKLSTMVFGSTEFAVRFPTVLIFFCTSIVLYKLAKNLYSEQIAFFTIVLLNIIPVFSFLGAVLTVPDAPLALCWALFAFIFHRIIIDKRPNLSRWYVLGAVLGAGLLSKYNAVLLPVSAGLFLLLSREHRRLLRTKGPYIALAVALIMFSAVIAWNGENNWVSFGFQLRHGFGTGLPHFSIALLGRTMGAQAGYLSPLFFFLYWALAGSLSLTAVKALRRQATNHAQSPALPALFIFSFSLPTLILFNAIAGFNEILPHWPAMGYLLLTISAGHFIVSRWDNRPARIFITSAASLAIFLTVLVPVQALFKPLRPEWFMSKTDASKIEDGVTKAEKVDVTNELYGWKEVGEKLTEMMTETPNAFIFSHRHYVSSQVAFAVPSHPFVYTLSDRIDAYDLWQRDISALDGRDALFVTNDYFYIDPQTVFPFASFDKPVTLKICRRGKVCRIFWITRCRQFALAKLPTQYTATALGEHKSIAAALIRIDHRVFWFFNRTMHFPALDFVMGWVSKIDMALGLNTGLIVLLTIVGIVLWNTRREKFLAEFLLAIAIVAIGGILVNFMKDWIGRLRPPAVFGGQVKTFAEIFFKGSFPSGHTQIAFAVATFLTSRVKKYWWAFYLFAVFIGFSRMYIGVHFPSDVVAGAIIGSGIALIMTKLIKL